LVCCVGLVATTWAETHTAGSLFFRPIFPGRTRKTVRPHPHPATPALAGNGGPEPTVWVWGPWGAFWAGGGGGGRDRGPHGGPPQRRCGPTTPRVNARHPKLPTPRGATGRIQEPRPSRGRRPKTTRRRLNPPRANWNHRASEACCWSPCRGSAEEDPPPYASRGPWRPKVQGAVEATRVVTISFSQSQSTPAC